MILCGDTTVRTGERDRAGAGSPSREDSGWSSEKGGAGLKE